MDKHDLKMMQNAILPDIVKMMVQNRGLRELVGLLASLACNLDTELACNLDTKVLKQHNVGAKTKKSFILYISLHF